MFQYNHLKIFGMILMTTILEWLRPLNHLLTNGLCLLWHSLRYLFIFAS